MARNGSGTYSLPTGNPVVTGTTISSTVHNNTLSDIATALTNSLAKNGETTPTANIPLGGFKLTGLGAATAAGDAVRYEQVLPSPTFCPATAIPAGGTAGTGVMVSSTANFGVFFGSGAPSLSAAKGSLYLRSDGSATNNRMYVNTDGSTTWTAVTTAA